MNTKSNIGDLFQQQTKHNRHNMQSMPLDWANQPGPYKSYPNTNTIKLPKAEFHGGPGLWQTIMERRSQREFSSTPVSKIQLSQLLWASQGITRQSQGFDFRAAPSAGALYPIETYLVINNVTEIEPGTYHYNVQRHYLEQLKTGNFGPQIAQAALGQNICAQASVVFIWTAVFQRSKWKYKQRAYRYIYLDAGHIAHAVALASTGMDLGSCQIAALFDDEVNDIIGVDGEEESVVYMTVVGTS
jgi:SagB-type dehydrogenase family enzyme